MSFSSDTKKELCSLKFNTKIEALLELAAIARMNANVLVRNQGEVQLRFFSESKEVILRVIRMIDYLYGQEPDMVTQQNEQLKQAPVYSTIFMGKALDLFFEESGYDALGSYKQSAERILSRLKSEENARTYLRGAFLGGGSVTNPIKAYHFEIVVPSSEDIDLLLTILKDAEIDAKVGTRRDMPLLYIKDSEMISNILVYIGAPQAMLKLEDAKAMKDLRNDINRKVNAETANMDKQLDASFRQMKAIRYIAENGGLEQLPDSLIDVAHVRLEHPQANLKQLGELMEPPLSKSGVSHRLRKITSYAEDLAGRKLNK